MHKAVTNGPIFPTAVIFVAMAAAAIAQPRTVKLDPKSGDLVTITVSRAVADTIYQSLAKQLGQTTAGKQAVDMLVQETAKALASAEAELARLQATSEKDDEFNDPRTVTPQNPKGTFSPMSTVNRKKAIEMAQSNRDTAFIRHEWAKRQMGK